MKHVDDPSGGCDAPSVLDAIFRPRAVAVVGASQKPRSIGGQICRNIIASGFNGALYPVNPRYQHVQSIPCHASVEDLPAQVDLAIIAVPAGDVLDVVAACGAGGVGGLVVVSAGFGEQPGQGEALQERLVTLCREQGMRLVGPNCMGVVNTAPDVSLNATFARTPPLPGNVAFMSQSGALGEAILAHAAALNLGVSMFASVGNRADVNATDLLDYWREDARTDVVLLYLESFGDPRRFVPALRRASRAKPIVAVKAGSSEAGRRAVLSHTGSLAGLDVTTDALFAQCGVLRARSVPELFDIARALASQPLPAGRRVAVITNAGGPGAMAADALASSGLEIPRLSAVTQAAVAAEVHIHASVTNPVDLIASATPRHYAVAMEHILADPGVDAVLVIFVPPIITDSRGVLEAIAAAAAAAPDKPVLACLMGEEAVIDGVEVLHGRRIPLYAFPEAAATALDAMSSYAEHQARPEQDDAGVADVEIDQARAVIAAAMISRRTQLTSHETFRILSAYGLPMVPNVTVASPQAARRAASQLGYPVVLKVVSDVVSHKSDVQGVVLDIPDGDALDAQVIRMAEDLRELDPDLAFSIQPMVQGGTELICGLVTDPRFGPLVMFGLGGIHAETLGDVTFRLAPLGRAEALSMVEGIRARAILEGARGRPPIDKDRLVDVLVRLGQLATDFPEIVELDVNPLLAFAEGDRFCAVDGRIAIQALDG